MHIFPGKMRIYIFYFYFFGMYLFYFFPEFYLHKAVSGHETFFKMCNSLLSVLKLKNILFSLHQIQAMSQECRILVYGFRPALIFGNLASWPSAGQLRVAFYYYYFLNQRFTGKNVSQLQQPHRSSAKLNKQTSHAEYRITK